MVSGIDVNCTCNKTLNYRHIPTIVQSLHLVNHFCIAQKKSRCRNQLRGGLFVVVVENMGGVPHFTRISPFQKLTQA